MKRALSTIAAVMSCIALLAGAMPADAADMPGDADAGATDIPSGMPDEIPPMFGALVHEAWMRDCWSACTVWRHTFATPSIRPAGMDNIVPWAPRADTGFCYDSRNCGPYFNQGNQDFYSSRDDIPPWPSNGHLLGF